MIIMDPWKKFVDEVKAVSVKTNIEKPPKEIDCDLAVPCFGTKPDEVKKLAEQIKKKLPKKSLISDIRSMGPYMNFYLKYDLFNDDVLQQILKEKGYSLQAFQNALETGKGKKRVEEDVAAGDKIQGRGTPTVILNGTFVTNPLTEKTIEGYLGK